MSKYGNKRDIKKYFKVNADEAELIKKGAASFDDESKYFRYMIFENSSDNLLSHEDKKEIMELLQIVRSEMSRVGGNLNQLARVFNQSGKVGFKKLQESHEDLRFQQTDMMETLKSVIKKLE